MASQSEWEYRESEDPITGHVSRELYVEANEQYTISARQSSQTYEDQGELVITVPGNVVQVRAVNIFYLRKSLHRQVRSQVRFAGEEARRVRWHYTETDQLPQAGFVRLDDFSGGDSEFINQLLESDTLAVRFEDDLSGLEGRARYTPQTHTLTFDTAGLAQAYREHGLTIPDPPSALKKFMTCRNIGLLVVGGVILVLGCIAVANL